MKGKYTLELRTGKCLYKFEVKRKYTVLRGDSARGKTEFVNRVREYLLNGNSNSFLSYKCELNTVVLTLEEYARFGFMGIQGGNLLVILDEDVIDRIQSKKELHKLNDFDNYYILISRDSMSCLPYSVDEIYSISS